ncbi:MAG: cupin domain-containing protein [Eubacterium sp.]|jgi:quercetin dioxygenase-like cupin family protein|nr:cupin domain-containing protein [Eubacterium sp.]
MPIKNFLKITPFAKSSHSGEGLLNGRTIFGPGELDSPLKFINYTEMPPGSSIGLHTHKNDEEVYIILEGTGLARIDGQDTEVEPGDTILNKPFGEHALYNTGRGALKVLIFKVVND